MCVRKGGAGRMKAHNPLETHNKSKKSTTEIRIQQNPPFYKNLYLDGKEEFGEKA